ncbi:MAG: RusA family crossover junction endodeoxyribonuclease [Methylococcaceae bacterium]
MIVEFFVEGTPRTAGSKTVSILWACQSCSKRTKKPPEAPHCEVCNRVTIACTICGSGDIVPTPLYRPAGKYTKPWMDKVRSHALKAYPRGIIHDGPLAMIMLFQMRRPKNHYGTGRNAGILKEWAVDLRPTGKPDVLKCGRAVEDALNDVVFKDDSQVVWSLPHKRYAEKTGVNIQIMTAAEFEEKLSRGITLEDLE